MRIVNDENVKSTGDKTTANNNPIRSRLECFNCGKAGHIAKKCFMPRIECENCNRLGHRAEKCPMKKDVNTVKKVRGTSNLYERYIFVNGHKIQGLIDTGSSCTLLRISVAEKYNRVISVASDNVLRGFAGQVTTSNRSTPCNIRIMDATARVNAIIVPDDHLIYDVIVGRDFLEQEHIVTIKRGNRLIFKQLTAINNESDHINFLDVRKDTVRTGIISEEAKQQCADLIREFKDCIACSVKDLGKTEAASLDIRCTSDVPVVYRPYRLAETEKRIVREIIQELLANNIIRESNSPYASPIIPVKKKSVEYRMCVDYRKLNAITIKDKYSMPLIEEQIDKLGGNRYFTGLDLASGYYQVPVSADSIEKTAFVTPGGHYEFLRMPFGLTNPRPFSND